MGDQSLLSRLYDKNGNETLASRWVFNCTVFVLVLGYGSVLNDTVWWTGIRKWDS